jgi:CheY-like chemotaxis protein/class 3 adenylate cyclase
MRAVLCLEPVAAELVGGALREAGLAVEAQTPGTPLPPLGKGDVLFVGGRDGLELCRAARQNGSLSVVVSPDEDERPLARGAGARAFVALPATPDDIRMALECATRRRPLVLLVDDSSLIHRHTAPILEAAGYEVLSAYDGDEGLRLALSRRPDLVITDLEMPGRDGYALCRTLKEDPRTGSIPVVLCSALGQAHDLERGFDVGADDYLVKPVVPEELESRVATLLAAEGVSERERVLAVDDSPAVRRLLADTLFRQGFCVELAENGQAALERARAAPPHLIITDYDMPVMSGFELVLELRKDPRTREVPILMLTAREGRRDQAQMRAAGLQSYLVKPFAADKCIAVVERLLAEARLRRYKAASRMYLSEGAVRAAERAQDAAEVRADERVMSVLFCDICGFTTLSSRLLPRQVVDLLNRFFDLLCPVLKDAQGDIDKFIGDCIMAVFEDLPDGEPGALRAARAALAMQRTLAEARIPVPGPGVELPRAEGEPAASPPLRMRIGVSTGPLVRGDLGSRFVRRDYTVIGDVVNRAQRLETAAPPGSVVISRATREVLGERARGQKVVLTLKGVPDPVEAFLLEEISE